MLSDLRLALRQLVKAPGFAAVAVLVAALGTYGVGAFTVEQRTDAVAILALSAAAALACWVPDRRAAKVDPMEVLRTE